MIEEDRVQFLERQLSAIYAEHGIDYELKWNRVRRYRPDIEAVCAGINLLINTDASFEAIVVEKATYEKWQDGDHESAFYLTYGLLAAHIAKARPDSFEFWIDGRSDSYDKRPEVMQIITNYRSRRLTGAAELAGVKMVDSKANAIVQMADVLIGAVTADTHRYLLGGNDLNEGKEEVITRLATMIGWDRLIYDTYPNSEFNVWHFPPEFRAVPATRHVLLASQRLQASTT